MPYSDLPNDAFWKLCLEDSDHHLNTLYRPKYTLVPGKKVATAGSCFAQHFGRHVKRSNLHFVDFEPPPEEMQDSVAREFGYGLFSARYGNIYTARQLLQLIEDCISPVVRDCAVWRCDEKFIDGLRPTVEPEGFNTREELECHRLKHLQNVRKVLAECDVFVFTLGLTEAWVSIEDATVFPMAPGTVGGKFDKYKHEFKNFDIFEILNDLSTIVEILQETNPKIEVILTVSPVPLTATATGQHVIQATTYSKSTLRVAAQETANKYENVDYFPSYEIITCPIFRSCFFESNLRSVTPRGVETVMSVFFEAHRGLSKTEFNRPNFSQTINPFDKEEDLVCEEIVLEEFAKK